MTDVSIDALAQRVDTKDALQSQGVEVIPSLGSFARRRSAMVSAALVLVGSIASRNRQTWRGSHRWVIGFWLNSDEFSYADRLSSAAAATATTAAAAACTTAAADHHGRRHRGPPSVLGLAPWTVSGSPPLLAVQATMTACSSSSVFISDRIPDRPVSVHDDLGRSTRPCLHLARSSVT